MKPGKPQKKPPVSTALEVETKRMEERLLELREHMKQETERRKSEARFKDGSRWRSGVTTRPLRGYADTVLKAKPRQRPASKGFVPSSELLEDKQQEGIRRTRTIPQSFNTTQHGAQEVKAFLESCGLEKYYEPLLAHGIEEMEVLMELTEEHLADVGLPLGHRIKLLKRIRDAKLAPAEAKVDNSYSQAQSDASEVENRSMFQEALNEFRKGGTTTHRLSSPKSTRPKELKASSTSPPEQQVSRSVDNADEALLSMSIPQGLMKDGLRDSCWECYKIFSEGEVFGNKNFCSAECVERFKSKLFLTCDCGKSFTKQDGELYGSQWFCSEDCPLFPETFIPIDPATGDPIVPQ